MFKKLSDVTDCRTAEEKKRKRKKNEMKTVF